jgi:D-serine deaminase-like pyridoxal phosphate-dependent protein
MGRCGVDSASAALALAQQVADAPGLRLAGLMGYEGHLVMLPDPEQRLIKVKEATGKLQQAHDLLKKHDLPVEIVSGGGTGTYDMTGTCAPMTEIQAGSYVVMDTTYLKIRPEFETALTVLTTVVSRPTPSRIVTDSGLKTVSKEFGWPQVVDYEQMEVQSLSEEHGKLLVTSPESIELQPGDKVQLIPSHCCTTINLHDNLYVVQEGHLADMWPIAARGRAQ